MKNKQLCPKSVRSILSTNKQQIRCSLCDSLLKTSSCYRYLLLGKSIHEKIVINNNETITYAECCQKYLNQIYQSDKLNMICPKCSQNLQHIYSLHLDAENLKKNMRRTLYKTKRLNRIRSLKSDDITIIEIKEEPSITQIPIESNENSKNGNYVDHFQSTQYRSNIGSINSAFVPLQTSHQIILNEHEYIQNFSHNHKMNNPTAPYAQFMIESPTSSTFSSQQQQQQDDSNTQQRPFVPDEDRSVSPCVNDDESGSKTTRLARRQYDFLIKLPDQQSLNAFIETSSSESNSRWTWRRTSANSRGYKVYYVCNYSMRRHYHPCPAAMYALFNPEGSISIYSHGQHQHIPKNHLPSTITDETKDEIFKCLQTDMSTGDIREHLVRLKLPFGDTKKLTNFIKYHKEILRFGAVTNVRLNGSAYRQPHYWAIRRSSPTNVNTII